MAKLIATTTTTTALQQTLLGIAELRDSGIKMLPTELLHVPLQSFGVIPADLLPTLIQRTMETGRETEEFELSLDQLSCYPTWNKPRMVPRPRHSCAQTAIISLTGTLVTRCGVQLQLGIDRGKRQLKRLSARLLSAEPYRPHLPLGTYAPIYRAASVKQINRWADTDDAEDAIYRRLLDRCGCGVAEEQHRARAVLRLLGLCALSSARPGTGVALQPHRPTTNRVPCTHTAPANDHVKEYNNKTNNNNGSSNGRRQRGNGFHDTPA